MTSVWDSIAEERHSQMVKGEDISLDDVLAPLFRQIISKYSISKEWAAIDIGCGTGYFTGKIYDILGSLVGIDPSQKSISIADSYLRDKKRISFAALDLLEAPSKLGSIFCLATSNMVFHTIENIDVGFAAVSKLLQHQGVFVFSIPHPSFWPAYKGLVSDPSFSHSQVSTHLVPFTITNNRIPLSETVPYIHRPISVYKAALKQAGLKLLKSYEPFPPREVQAKFRKKWSFPHFLVFECMKQ